MQLTIRGQNSSGVHIYAYVNTTRPKTRVSGHRGHQWIDAYACVYIRTKTEESGTCFGQFTA